VQFSFIIYCQSLNIIWVIAGQLKMLSCITCNNIVVNVKVKCMWYFIDFLQSIETQTERSISRGF